MKVESLFVPVDAECAIIINKTRDGRSIFTARITVSATGGYFSGPARTRCRSNSFPDRENTPGWLAYHSRLAETIIDAYIYTDPRSETESG